MHKKIFTCLLIICIIFFSYSLAFKKAEASSVTYTTSYSLSEKIEDSDDDRSFGVLINGAPSTGILKLEKLSGSGSVSYHGSHDYYSYLGKTRFYVDGQEVLYASIGNRDTYDSDSFSKTYDLNKGFDFSLSGYFNPANDLFYQEYNTFNFNLSTIQYKVFDFDTKSISITPEKYVKIY